MNSFQGLLTYEDVSRLWPYLPKVEWIAVLSAGLNRILAKEVIESDVLLTNGKVSFLWVSLKISLQVQSLVYLSGPHNMIPKANKSH